MSYSRSVLGTGVLFLILAATLGATPFELPEEESVVSATGYVSVEKVPRGSSFEIAVRARITPPWHINAHMPTDEFLVPTELVLETPAGVSIGRIVYPEPVRRTFAFTGTPLAVYEGQVVLRVTASASEEAELGIATIRGLLSYQACNDETCMPPTEVEFTIPVEVVPSGTVVAKTHEDLFEAIPTEVVKTSKPESAVAQLFHEKGTLLGFLVIFVWGLGLNLTPCVYPMIPLTVGYFGAQSGGRVSTRLGLAFTYFLGIALMYSSLGVVAAATGSLFGAALQNPAVPVVVAAILVGLSLSMFGVYEIRLPMFLMRLGGGSRQGALGSFVMGLTVGIVAAPCVGAVVAALLIYVAEMGDLFLGFWLFFALACGLGLPFLFLAVFSSSISSLPRSGEWMAWVRRLFGVLLIVMAVYFLLPLLPHPAGHYIYSASIVVGAIYLGFIDRTHSASKGFSWMKRAIGIVGVLFVLWLLMAKTPATTIQWEPYSAQAFRAALSSGKPAMVDFTAEWCIPCRELEHATFSDPRVLSKAVHFRAFQVDLTRSGNKEAQEIKVRYDVKGVPTILFVAPSGEEAEDLRVVGFIEADPFLERMEAMIAR